ncbi:MAG: hypothetical protein M1358_15795 [Chloroflexi bacterium]|nr:hypothetical protein [Chloroflexota bacterium]
MDDQLEEKVQGQDDEETIGLTFTQLRDIIRAPRLRRGPVWLMDPKDNSPEAERRREEAERRKIEEVVGELLEAGLAEAIVANNMQLLKDIRTALDK